MNLYLVIGGAIGLLGGLAHTTLGHNWTVRAVDEEHASSKQIPGAANVRFVMWFWHIGSALLLSTTLGFLLAGLGVVELSSDLLWYMESLWLATTAIGLVVALKPPSQFRHMVPVIVGIPINALVLLGLTAG